MRDIWDFCGFGYIVSKAAAIAALLKQTQEGGRNYCGIIHWSLWSILVVVILFF